MKCITIRVFDCLSLFLSVCLSVCLCFYEFLIPHLSLSLYLPILATLSLCTHLICFHCFTSIPSIHFLFPLTLILHRYHIDYAVMILICWWSWLITILTLNNTDMAIIVWIALNLVGFDLIMSHLFYCNLICYISSYAILLCSIVLWSASLWWLWPGLLTYCDHTWLDLTWCDLIWFDFIWLYIMWYYER